MAWITTFRDYQDSVIAAPKRPPVGSLGPVWARRTMISCALRLGRSSPPRPYHPKADPTTFDCDVLTVTGSVTAASCFATEPVIQDARCLELLGS